MIAKLILIYFNQNCTDCINTNVCTFRTELGLLQLDVIYPNVLGDMKNG
jgi:hypothetical protein